MIFNLSHPLDDLGEDGVTTLFSGYRVAKDSSVDEFLMDEALTRIREANAIIGCRAVRLDCTDELIGYYREYGFHFVKKNPDKDLNQIMFL